MKRTLTTLIAAICPLLTTAAAQHKVAIDTSVGTTGVGVNAQFKVASFLAVRGGYSFLDYDVADENYDGVDYDVSLEMTSFSAFLDIHPFKNGFTISGGMYSGGTRTASLVATPEEDVIIGGVTFTPEQVGTITGEATLNDMAPYLGIGWDRALFNHRNWGVAIRAGAMFAGEPETELTATGGLLANDPTFQAALADEEAALEDEIDGFEIYPVLTIGLTYAF